MKNKINAITKTSSANQTVVPTAIRDYLGYEGRMKLIWEVNSAIDNGNRLKSVTIRAVPLDADDWIAKAAGGINVSREESSLEKMRKEWED